MFHRIDSAGCGTLLKRSPLSPAAGCRSTTGSSTNRLRHAFIMFTIPRICKHPKRRTEVLGDSVTYGYVWRVGIVNTLVWTANARLKSLKHRPEAIAEAEPYPCGYKLRMATVTLRKPFGAFGS